MFIYNIYFDVKKGTEQSILDKDTEQNVIELTLSFIDTLKQQSMLSSAQLHQQLDKATFRDLPDFHLQVMFEDEKHMDDCFLYVRQQLLTTYPHSELMNSVTNFKVSFAKSIG